MTSLGCDNQDPDYFMIFSNDVNSQSLFEKNARTNAYKKISAIIEDQFLNEINNKKTEIYKIYKNLNKASKMLHYLRFAIVTDFYNRKNIFNNDIQVLKQSRLHYTVTSFTAQETLIKDIDYKNNCFEELDIDRNKKRKMNENTFTAKYSENIELVSSTNNWKIKKRIIVGNISKWISPDFRDGSASHKWTMYIRDSHKCDIGQFISKVRFFLHPSYKPNDVIELTSTPFHLSRHGWGEFPVRVQLHFTNNFNKPVDIIHYLKLDRTFTGLQTIGSETIVDLWINMKDTPIIDLEESMNNKSKKANLSGNNYFLTDHNYMSTNLKFKRKISNLQKSQEFRNSVLQAPQNNFNTLDKYSIFNLKIKNNSSKVKNKNVISLSKTDQLLIKQSKTFEHSICQNYSVNNSHKSKCISNIQSLQNNYSISSKKIYLKHDNYIDNKENFKALVNLIKYTKPNTLFNALKLVIKNVPLVTEKSVKLCYKILNPYTTKSHQQFYNYSKGKQESLERYRAIQALNIFKSTEYNICTTNEIITWARRFSYSPLKNIHKTKKLNKLINIEIKKNTQKNTSTISDQLNKWLLQCHTINLNFINFVSENNEQIDILNTPLNIPDSLSVYQNNLKEKNNTLILIEYPEIDDILNEFVYKSIQKIGIKLENEEIIPGVLHSTASVLIIKALEYLIDDLIRLAFSCSLDTSKNSESIVFIKVDDVRTALLKKEEFEIFTNAGLGSEG